MTEHANGVECRSIAVLQQCEPAETFDAEAIDVACRNASRSGFDSIVIPSRQGANPSLLSTWLDAAKTRGLAAILDVNVREVPAHATIVAACPNGFRPLVHDPDPRAELSIDVATNGTTLLARSGADAALGEWWADRCVELATDGLAGIRLLAPNRIAAPFVRNLIDAIRRRAPSLWISVDTVGLAPHDIEALSGLDADAAFSSLAWWDGNAAWYYDEDARLRTVARRVIAVVRKDAADAEGDALRALIATEIADGLLMPSCGESSDATYAVLKSARAAFSERGRCEYRLRPLLRNRRELMAVLLDASVDIESAKAPSKIIVANMSAHVFTSIALDELLAETGIGSIDMLAADQVADASPGYLTLGPRQVRTLGVARFATVKPSQRPLTPNRAQAIERRIAIENVMPALDGGRFAVKRCIGDRVRVSADIFIDGHDRIAASIAWKRSDRAEWQRAPMRAGDNDRWVGEFTLDAIGRYDFIVEAWLDEFATLRNEIDKKLAAGVLVPVDLADARALLDVYRRRGRTAATAIRGVLDEFDRADDDASRARVLLAASAATAMAAAGERPFLARCEPLPIESERLAARYSSWYELFPRSAGAPGAHGTFDDVITRLPAIRAMGFDVLYLPPIHPIGSKHRKGKNNALRAGKDDPGSPYAIGAADGGHDAVHAELGGIAAFRRLVAAARAHGIEIALDFAIQASPDHPWLRRHAGWFTQRADGSIRHAENPPKKYEDIYNVDFYTEAAIPGLWKALRDVVLHWVGEGVRIFRVDNPHTKPFPFWEWMMADVRSREPDVIFLAEAFTRPKPMYRLAKLGFSQSYTYFIWRERKVELIDYLRELNAGEPRECFRPNFFVNTPDINPYVLQQGGRAAHLIRAALATMLSGSWGMYSGFELCEATALPGREEYADSEKYQLRNWDWQRAGNIVAEITRLNLLRRNNPELQTHLGVEFLGCDSEQIIYFAKGDAASGGLVLVAINLDWQSAHTATIEVPLWKWQLADAASIDVEDLWSGARYQWHGKNQRISIDTERPFQMWRIFAPAMGATAKSPGAFA